MCLVAEMYCIGGKYPLLKNPAAIAASEKLTLLGETVFTGDSSSELIFISAGSIDSSRLTSISHPGILGFGSFDSLQIENVSLTASELHLGLWTALFSIIQT